MRILICRHGDPNYELDSLTERGFVEAELLSERLVEFNPTQIYVSVLGRAKKTAEPTAKKTGIEPIECDWLREYPMAVNDDPAFDLWEGWHCPWDVPHKDWYPDKQANDPYDWYNSKRCKGKPFKEHQEKIRSEIDRIMADIGLVREGDFYRAAPEFEQHKDDTILFFCHYGATLAILAALLPISGLTLWNGFSLDASSVTELMADNVEKDIFMLRVMRVGDISHLYKSGLPLGKAPRQWWYNKEEKDTGPKV